MYNYMDDCHICNFFVFSFRDLGSGRGGTIPIKGELPAIPSTEPWDGKDGEVIKLINWFKRWKINA